MDSREPQIRNHGRLVERQARGADGVEGPAEEEEPDANVAEGGGELLEREVCLGGARRVIREARLHELSLVWAEEGCCCGDWIVRRGLVRCMD